MAAVSPPLPPAPAPAAGQRPGSRAPSITRLFAATFLAVAVVGLANRVAIWRNARHTQATMIELVDELQDVRHNTPSPVVEAKIADVQERAAEAADDAMQAAAATTVIFIAMMVVLGLGFWYNRRQLGEPFQDIVTALERVTQGRYGERLDESRPDELGLVAHGVNQLATTLALREWMQDFTAHLLAALNTSPGDSAGLAGALGVIAAACDASGLALYQPDYDANAWAPTATRGFEARPLLRAVVRELVAESTGILVFRGEAAKPVRHKLGLPADPGSAGELAVAPLRSGERLSGLLLVETRSPLTPDRRAALEVVMPNLAIASERESAYQHTRRLASEIRRTAQHLEEQSDELTRLNTELDRASRLKSEFLTNMSHELRTPLNSIIGFSDMLLTEDIGPLTTMQRDFLETVARNGRHLLQLISELLDLSKIEVGRLELQREPLVLADVIDEAATSVRTQIEKRRHRLVIDSSSGTATPARLLADRQRVRQVLLNLLSNAIKFTPDGGTITVAARDDDSAVRVAVSDTGIGIATADQEKLFKEFVQLDASASRQYEGTGLGLALSRRLVELHGGVMGVESEPGKGSTFWFTLPLSA